MVDKFSGRWFALSLVSERTWPVNPFSRIFGMRKLSRNFSTKVPKAPLANALSIAPTVAAQAIFLAEIWAAPTVLRIQPTFGGAVLYPHSDILT